MGRREGPLRSFGRMKGRPLKPRQAALMESLLPHIAAPAAGAVTAATLFPDGAARPLTLEIGFGGGEHLAARAAGAPEGGFLGVEPFLNGVASALQAIDAAGLTNIRIYQGDAREVLARMPGGALDCVYILFPDPWPKTRHWKRRLIQPAFAAELARVLKSGGEVRFATDWAAYAEWSLAVFLGEPAFEWRAESAADWRAPWPGHSPTRYERKRLGDCAPVFLRFVRHRRQGLTSGPRGAI
ncbi:MAG: tRNA (guanosine(46)-N7)-methyltransferase TrmB [Hyphomonadaceae bacterium]